MKLFKCQVCSQVLYFESSDLRQVRLQARLRAGAQRALRARAARGELADYRRAGGIYKFCANAAYDACNWLLDRNDSHDFCLACRHNGIIPDLSDQQNLANWRKIEAAKHRLFYTLLRLDLPLPARDEDREGLVFNFLAELAARSRPRAS